MVIATMVEFSCDIDIGIVVAAGVDAEVGAVVGVATGSIISFGVVEPPHPTMASIAKAPSKTEATEFEARDERWKW